MLRIKLIFCVFFQGGAKPRNAAVSAATADKENSSPESEENPPTAEDAATKPEEGTAAM